MQWRGRYHLPKACKPLPSNCTEEEEEEAGCPNRPRVWIGSSSRCSGCSGIDATFELSTCACSGSAFSPLLVALSSDFIPLLVSWQNCISLQSEIRSPLDSNGGSLLLQSEDTPPLPILGQMPSTFYNAKGHLEAVSCSMLCVQRSALQDSFEIFFLFWDEECGYAYINSGKSWKRNSQTLQSVGNASLKVSLKRCEKVGAAEEELIGTPWQATFKLQLGAKNPSKCAQLSLNESALLQAWIRG